MWAFLAAMHIMRTFGALPTRPWDSPMTGDGSFALATATPATADPWFPHGMSLLGTILLKTKVAKTFVEPSLMVPWKSRFVGTPPEDCTPVGFVASGVGMIEDDLIRDVACYSFMVAAEVGVRRVPAPVRRDRARGALVPSL